MDIEVFSKIITIFGMSDMLIHVAQMQSESKNKICIGEVNNSNKLTHIKSKKAVFLLISNHHVWVCPYKQTEYAPVSWTVASLICHRPRGKRYMGINRQVGLTLHF